MEIRIHSNDHDPPHFHVVTKDVKINAKFKIENCEIISGEISSKLKRIKVFYNSRKGKLILESIWDKRRQ